MRTAGQYIWPRGEHEFNELVEGRELWIVTDEDAVRGLCYCSPGAVRWEFGGIFVDPELRGRGIAAAIGRVAISTAYAYDAPPELIAHVHEFNEQPRGLLTRNLGFRDTGEAEIPPVEPPASMKRNANDDVVGDLFQFEPAALDSFADWIEEYNGEITGKDGVRTVVEINADLIHDRDLFVPALRRRAAEG